MENSGDTRTPSSSHVHAAVPQRWLLYVLMMLGKDIVMSLLDKKLYICLHKVAKVDREAMDTVVRILKEKASVSDTIICEVADTAAVDDKAVIDLIKQIESQVNIPLIYVSPVSKFARVLNLTSEAYRYTSNGHMQYAVEKKMADVADHQTGHTSSGIGGDPSRVNDIITSSNEGAIKKNNNNGDSQVDVCCSSRRKGKRLVWTQELKRAFADAVDKLGLDTAVPKKILELMNWPGLTRENVASRLQKYRMSVKNQQNGVQMHQNDLRWRRRKFTSSPPPVNTTTTDPVMQHNWPKPPVTLGTPQLNIHGGDPSGSSSSSIGIQQGGSSFNIMHDTSHIDGSSSYMFDDNIDLLSQGFGWDTQDGFENFSWNEMENSYGGVSSGWCWPDNFDSFDFVCDGVTAGLIDESVNKTCLVESDPLSDKMMYDVVPQGDQCCSVLPENDNECVNNGHQQQENYTEGIQNYSSVAQNDNVCIDNGYQQQENCTAGIQNYSSVAQNDNVCIDNGYQQQENCTVGIQNYSSVAQNDNVCIDNGYQQQENCTAGIQNYSNVANNAQQHGGGGSTFTTFTDVSIPPC